MAKKKSSGVYIASRTEKRAKKARIKPSSSGKFPGWGWCPECDHQSPIGENCYCCEKLGREIPVLPTPNHYVGPEELWVETKEHSDIDALVVSSRPPEGAPIRVLLGYLFRQWWRRQFGHRVWYWRRTPATMTQPGLIEFGYNRVDGQRPPPALEAKQEDWLEQSQREAEAEEARVWARKQAAQREAEEVAKIARKYSRRGGKEY